MSEAPVSKRAGTMRSPKRQRRASGSELRDGARLEPCSVTLTGVCASAYGGVTEKTCAGASGSKRVRGTAEAPKCAPPSNESVRPTVTAERAAGARHRIVPSCASDAAEVAAVKRAASAAV